MMKSYNKSLLMLLLLYYYYITIILLLLLLILYIKSIAKNINYYKLMLTFRLKSILYKKNVSIVTVMYIDYLVRI